MATEPSEVDSLIQPADRGWYGALEEVCVAICWTLDRVGRLLATRGSGVSA